jgi:hypothetical protein
MRRRCGLGRLTWSRCFAVSPACASPCRGGDQPELLERNFEHVCEVALQRCRRNRISDTAYRNRVVPGGVTAMPRSVCIRGSTR